MTQFKLLLFSHLSVFATGIYVGRSIDAEELAAYRSASNDATSAWLKKLLLGIGAAVAVTTSGMLLFGRYGGTSRKRLT